MTRPRSFRRALALGGCALVAGSAALAVPAATPAGAATGLTVQRFAKHTVAPGLSWRGIAWTNDHGYQRGWVMSVDLTHKALHIKPGMANGNVNDRETIPATGGRMHALGGINGDLFNWYTWLPWGGIGINGTVFKTPAKDRPSQFYIGTDGRAGIGSLVFTGSVRQVSATGAPGAAHVLSAVNTPGSANAGNLTLFTPAVTGLPLDRCAAVSGPVIGRLLTVRRVHTEVKQFDRLPTGRRLLAACGKSGDWLLAHAHLGQRLRITQHLTTSSGAPVSSFLSGQRLLRLHGHAVADSTGFHTTGINPETAACVSKDGTQVRFIVIDGWMSGGDLGGGTGVTLAEVSQLAATMHCYSTVIFDGGGSATMVARRSGAVRVVNQMPKHYGLRAVPNGLFVVKD
ncbi:MAG: hypothetical protein QOJ34_897 [Pseudonocardiales bacterium]|nr:hypothetical protein [Pseudonocardiales bacterium]